MKISGGIMSITEIEKYRQYVKASQPGKELVGIEIDGDHVILETKSVPFERIRRITGYLVGNMNRWGTSKRAEERDRVKHGTVS